MGCKVIRKGMIERRQRCGKSGSGIGMCVVSLGDSVLWYDVSFLCQIQLFSLFKFLLFEIIYFSKYAIK